MQALMPSSYPVQLTLVGTRVGAKVAKALIAIAVSGKLTPELLGEAIISSSSVRSHVQAEALRFVAIRVSMRSPQRLAWLVRVVTEYLAAQSGDAALRNLGKRTMFYHITAFGLQGTVASALATAAVSVGFQTCSLVTSNACFWREAEVKMSLRQYRYDIMTSCFVGVGTVIGGGVGAAAGTMILPGFGTALGSIVCSFGGGYLPGRWRDKGGPDDRRRAHLRELRRYTPLVMRERPDGFVEMDGPGTDDGGAAKSTPPLMDEGTAKGAADAVDAQMEEVEGDGVQRESGGSFISFSNETPQAPPAPSEEEAPEVLRSQLCFTRFAVPTSVAEASTDRGDEEGDEYDCLSDAGTEEAAAAHPVQTARGVDDALQRLCRCFGGKMELVVEESWAAVDAKVEGDGNEDDVVFVFKVNSASS